MTTLLRIDASARSDRSITRAFADHFISAFGRNRKDLRLLHQDVGRTPPPFVSEDWIAAAFAEGHEPSHQPVLAASDAYIDQVEQADLIVLATPMYNYGMPATLKAWFDQVIRVDRTFTFDLARGDRPLEPVLSGKTLVLLTSSGEFGFGPGELNDGADHLVPHIRYASKYLGVDRFHHVGVEYQEFGGERHAQSKTAAWEIAERLANTLKGQDAGLLAGAEVL